MKLIATAAALALAAAPALAQTTTPSPSASPAPPAPAQAGTAPAPATIGPGLAGVQPALIGGAVAFAGLGIWALSQGGSNETSTPSTPTTR